MHIQKINEIKIVHYSLKTFQGRRIMSFKYLPELSAKINIIS